MVSEEIKNRPIQVYTKNLNSSEFTVMFDLSKSFSQLYLEICRGKIDFVKNVLGDGMLLYTES